jgi:hypothetical protein
MSKHVKTLSAIGSAIASWSNGITAADVARKALVAQCTKLSLVEKQKIDAELVNYYADKAGVGVKTREKAHALFCDVVPAWKKNEKGQVTNPAAMALSRARGVLFAAEKGDTHKRSGKAGAASLPKLSTENIGPTIGAFVERFTIGGEKINAAQKKEIRHAITMLTALLA